MNSNDTERDGVQTGVTEHSVTRMEALFRTHRDGLVRFLKLYLWGSPEEANELAQEAFTRLLELPKEREVNNWDALLWTIARNLLNTRREQRRIHQAALPQLQIELENNRTAEISWTEEQAKAAARRAIAELPERQQRVIALRAKGQTYPRIAQELGIDERTCRRDIELAILEIRTKIGLET